MERKETVHVFTLPEANGGWPMRIEDSPKQAWTKISVNMHGPDYGDIVKLASLAKDNHVKWYDKYQLVTMDGSWHGNEDYEGHSNETALQNYEMLLSQLIVMLDHIAEDGVAIIRAKMKYASGAVVLTLLSRMFESVEPVKLDEETCGNLWHSIFSYVICQKFKSQSRDGNLKIINEFLGEIKEGSTFFLEEVPKMSEFETACRLQLEFFEECTKHFDEQRKLLEQKKKKLHPHQFSH
ncbi:uncharacterized protein LOC134853440 [Symsagittifera roscoffensis]|uniref:uncharacterized protein LOC134853440 n=1 Tax=Symsagittifera roscoffensis TaxID=84072 RepID=UPI00307B45E7